MTASCLSGTLDPTRLCDPDAKLMLRAKRGDEEALAFLIQKHRAAILRFAYRMVRDHNSSEDIAQEIFLRVYRSRENYEVTAKFTTWLNRIAAHVALNWIRDHARVRSHETLDLPRGSRMRGQFFDHGIRIDEWLLRESRNSELRYAVDQLPDRQRTIVRLHKFQEIECEAIAQMLGCSNQAVRSALCRAYSSLRRHLAKSGCAA
jgi:RNA polymerase sigma-70 factor (ECF subfamily)